MKLSTDCYIVRPKLKKWFKSGGTSIPNLLLIHGFQDVQLRLIRVSFDRAFVRNGINGEASYLFNFTAGIATDRGVSIPF